MGVISLLNQDRFVVNKKITIKIPTLAEMRGYDFNTGRIGKLDNDFENLMNLFIITPSNNMVELWDMGIDFTQISEWEYFLLLFDAEFNYAKDENLYMIDSTKVFEGIDFSKCRLKQQGNDVMIVDENGECVINELVYMQLSNVFCEILNTTKYRRKPADNTAKEFILDMERKHIKHRKRRSQENRNAFDELIIAMVCEHGFPYDFDTINKLTIYDFNCCVKQIIKRVNYDNLSLGLYGGMGTIDRKKIKSSDLNFLSFR